MFLHHNWKQAGLVEKLKAKAASRNLKELTIGPVLTWNNQQIQAHIDECLKIPGM